MNKRDLLAEIRDGMRGLAEMENPRVEDIIMGLLLTIQTLRQSGEIAHLACQIHGDAQTAWGKARKKERNDE